MEPAEWSNIARALRAERKVLEGDLTRNGYTADIRAALLVITALENAAMKMAGGYVMD